MVALVVIVVAVGIIGFGSGGSVLLFWVFHEGSCQAPAAHLD